MRVLSFQTVSTAVPRFVTRAATSLGVLFLWPTQPAAACGGPCTTPELWSLQPTSDKLVVVSNFGIIGQGQDGWVLACEEHIGGILLDVKAAGQWLVALTDSGVWLSHNDVCSWTKGPTSERSTWFFDSALGPTSGPAPELIVLAPDAIEQHTNLERADGAAFEIVRSFESTVAFRNLAASVDLSHIFVSGYSQGPRTWHLSFSLDAGENWSDIMPSEVDNAGAAIVPKGVDPNEPTRLFLSAQTPSGGGDELWLFDARTNTTRLLTTLSDGEVLSNVAFRDEEIWIAGRRNGAGSLYRAQSDTLEFTRLFADAPSLACLEVSGSTLLTCANDYSYESTFLVAEVGDSGTTFVPEMRVPDLVNLRACSNTCSATQDWLTTTYGSVTPVDTTTATNPPPPSDLTEDTPKPEARRSNASGCTMVPHVLNAGASCFTVVALWVSCAMRRRRK